MEAAELFRQGEIGSQYLQKFRANRRDVNGVADNPFREKIYHLFRHGGRNIQLRFIGRRPEMRGGDHLVHLDQRMASRRRLIDVNVQSGRPFRYDTTDVAEADNSNGLVAELDSDEFVAIPLAALQ